MEWFSDVGLVLYWLSVLAGAAFVCFVVVCVVVGINEGVSRARREYREKERE